MERHAVARAELGEVGVVRDDRRDLGVELPRAAAEQLVVQAVAVFADEHQQARAARQRVHLRLHAEAFAQRRAQRMQRAHVAERGRGLEMHAHEEQPGGVVGEHVAELLRVDDVAAGFVQQPRNGVDDALGIGARQGQDKLIRAGHGLRFVRFTLYEGPSTR